MTLHDCCWLVLYWVVARLSLARFSGDMLCPWHYISSAHQRKKPLEKDTADKC